VNVGLSKADKTVLSNAVYVLGPPEPPNSGRRTVIRGGGAHRAAKRRQRGGGPVVRGQTVRVRVPVSYGEEVRYVVSAPLSLKHLAALLDAQHLPESWVISLVDREKRIIARIPALPAGVEESEALREHAWARPRRLVPGARQRRPRRLHRLHELGAERLDAGDLGTRRHGRRAVAARVHHPGGRAALALGLGTALSRAHREALLPPRRSSLPQLSR
jgi:hypothetical protein